MTAETHANASVSCLKYLCCARLGPPINLHHTPRNIARRRNSPWHWNRYKKFMNKLPTMVHGKRRHTITLRDLNSVYHHGWEQASSMCENLTEQVERHQKYTDTTRLGLNFLRRALPLSAPSSKLIALLHAEKSFGQRAAAFPIRLKKCKVAIATYLARVEPKTEPETSRNGETALSSDELGVLPVGDKGVPLPDRDPGLAEPWWMWIARGKTSGVDELNDGHWGDWGYIPKFLLPISLSFVLSIAASYFS